MKTNRTPRKNPPLKSNTIKDLKDLAENRKLECEIEERQESVNLIH